MDYMLQGAMDFLDVNDLASVNLVLAESSAIHVELVSKMKKLREREKDSKLKMNVQVKQTTNFAEAEGNKDGQELAVEEDVYQTASATSARELNNNMYVHMGNAFTGANLVEKILKDKKERERQQEHASYHNKDDGAPKNSLLHLQQNLVQSLNTLRYMNSREAKTKILYTLNYFRSIQKRLMLDQREFGTRERVVGDVIDPILPAEEADSQLVDTYNMVLANTNKMVNMAENQDRESESILKSKTRKASGSMFGDSDRDDAHRSIQKLKENQKKAKIAQAAQHQLDQDTKYQILPPQAMNAFTNNENEQGLGLVDIKKYRRKGKFHDKHLATCPILPRFHATFGEPSEIRPEFMDQDHEEKPQFISLDSMRFLNRVDHIEIDDAKMEVFIKDDFNIYIMNECALTDM